VQVPAALSVQVVGLKLPPTPPAVPKVTTPPVTTPADPLSVAVTVMPVVDPYAAETALTVATVGATASPVPPRAMVCIALAAFRSVSVSTALPLMVPMAVGVKSMAILQLASSARV